MIQPLADAAGEHSISFPLEIDVTAAGRPPIPLPAEFRYERSDPYAVCLALGAPTTASVDWVFARSLLAEGLRRPAGIGDVQVTPRRHSAAGHPSPSDTVRILLRTRDGAAATLEVRASAVTAFLRRTDVMVAPGTEHHHLDLDRVTTRLTAGGP
ncbi:SsgA family sporulation/cell division regulator [Streptomyces sp. R21]|uniref:SsgA family sporulation/cell division regulator n=1 Tax=Streptomyces sp. R21 TaxID=3238627 RepID=A0AB39PKF3_9ACTN